MLNRRLRNWSILLALALAMPTSCSSPWRVSKLERQIPRELKVPGVFAVLPPGERFASMGDVMFELRRYVIDARELIAVSSPPGLDPFPVSATWEGTHKFVDDEMHEYIIFTTPAYYHGAIGVMLDEEDRLATDAPLIKVAGELSGRRWPLPAGVKFFYVPTAMIESWGLRFGGRRSSELVFEVVNRSEPTTTEILQSLQVTEADFTTGFVVRGVKVQGTPGAEIGTIRYTLTDLRGER